MMRLTVANKPEKKSSNSLIEQNSNQADRSLVPINHHSDARVISMATEFITTACSSFRAAGKSLKIIEKYLPMDTPSVLISNWAKRCKALFDKNKKQKPTTSYSNSRLG